MVQPMSNEEIERIAEQYRQNVSAELRGEKPPRNTWMPTVLRGGGPGRLSLLQHLIQCRHNRVTFMLNT